MPKALIIIAYFGKFPTEFPFWLRSCERNKDDGYHWLLVTDQEAEMRQVTLPENVHPLFMSFNDFRNKVQTAFDFPIVLSRPQKICDYKPAYGLIFKDYLDGYQYWGHCDMDLIFGRLDYALAQPIEQRFERILELGHLSLYLNNDKMINAFKVQQEGCLYFKDVYSTPEGKTFDEDGWPPDSPLRGLATLFQKSGINTWKSPNCFADVNIGTWNISPLNFPSEEKITRSFYALQDNRLLHFYQDVNNQRQEREIIYVHAQKRPWIIKTNELEHFKLIPPGKLISGNTDWNATLIHAWLCDKFFVVKRYVFKRIKYLPQNLKTLFSFFGKKRNKHN